jgi:hypothetical protein
MNGIQSKTKHKIEIEANNRRWARFAARSIDNAIARVRHLRSLDRGFDTYEALIG